MVLDVLARRADIVGDLVDVLRASGGAWARFVSWVIRASIDSAYPAGFTEAGMNGSNEQGGGFAVCVGFGAIFAILMALLIVEPKAAIWISDAVDAEFSHTQNQTTVRLAEPTRRPIHPGEWVKPLKEAAN